MSTEDGERLSRELGVLFIETSAKAGFNVKALFRRLATSLPGAVAGGAPAPTAAESNLIDIKLQAVPPADGGGAGGACSC